MKKTIVFDMDGVLFDTELICMKAWTAVAEKNGLPGMEEIFPKCIGGNADLSRRIVLEAYGEDFDYAHFRRQASDEFWDYIKKNGLPVKPGAEEILRWLRENGWAIGLASSTKKSSVLSLLEQAGLLDFFAAVVSGDMVEHSKPNPEIYLLACRELSAEPSQTYAVEDSPNGVRSACGAGLRTLMVPDMIPADEEMRRLSEGIFDDLYRVRDFLNAV